MSPADEIHGTAVKIRQLPSAMQKVERSAARRAARALRQAALDRFTAGGVGRAIFKAKADVGKKGARTKALRVVFPSARVTSPGEGHLQISYTLRGFAALVELGGKTKAHEIKASGGLARKGVLAFAARGVQLFALRVKHPGSRIPQTRFLDAAGEKALDVLRVELEAGYQQAAGAI